MDFDVTEAADKLAILTEGWSPIMVILLVVLAIIAFRAPSIIKEWRAGSNQKLLNENQHTEAIKRLNIEEKRLDNEISGADEGRSDDA